MDEHIQMPAIIYDGKCEVCSIFAKMISFFGRGRISLDPKNPTLVLSKGHALSCLAGYFEKSQLLTLRKFESKLQGHPDLKCPGVEFCGGSLGIGLSFSLRPY